MIVALRAMTLTCVYNTYVCPCVCVCVVCICSFSVFEREQRNQVKLHYDKMILVCSDQIVCGALCLLVCIEQSLCSLKRASESSDDLWQEIDLFTFSLMVHNSRSFQLIQWHYSQQYLVLYQFLNKN